MDEPANAKVFEHLANEQAKQFLVPHEVVRDPVQHDISITALERAAIDTQAFQRLRWLNQLGPTQMVYPGAVHTRFMHSLGTLQVLEQMVGIANRNSEIYASACPYVVGIGPYPHLLARICALLHDVAHMPFGHTLEDEGNLADPEWEDKERANHWLGEASEILQKIKTFLIDSGIPEAAARSFIADVSKYVLFKGDPSELEYPFVIDLIGNTLCADLLDYVYRDMYFCGLPERSGDRVTKYLAVVRLVKDEEGTLRTSDDSETGKGRVVLLTYRFEREHPAGGRMKPVLKNEIITEAIDLLRRRYALAEKVYFHRTKLAASAMLISAMGSSSVKSGDIYSLSDAAFLSLLEKDPNARTKRILEAYMSRRLYKPIYRIGYREERDSDAESAKLWSQYDQFRDPKWRAGVEQKLETYANLPPGSVTAYCPDRRMNLKEFEMLVQTHPGAEVKKLENILDRSWKTEMEAINQRFEPLWSLLVFVDPDALDPSLINDPRVQDFSALCETLFDFPNDMLELRHKGSPLREQIATRVIREFEEEGGPQVLHSVFEELVAAPHRSQGEDLVSEMRKHLRSLVGVKSSKPQKQ